nr:uncharacterized protein LOC104115987 [Nicotiana tomentosiformis]
MEGHKQLKEQNDRIEQILGVPPVIKGVDIGKYSQQPWKPSATPLPIPKRFKMPDIPKYDGTTDPRDHVTAFTTGVKGNDLTKQEIESVLVKKFGETLTKGALTWYSLILKHSIDYFAELTDSFIKVHSGAQKVKKGMEDIFKIKQGDTELLRDFVDRFQRERMMLPRVPDNWAAMAYSTKLQIEEDTITRSRGDERTSLRRPKIEKRSGKNSYEPYMGPAGRDSRSKQEKPRYGSRSRDRDAGSSSKFGKERDARDNNVNTNVKIGDYSFNVSTSELVAVLRNMGDKVRWPKEMRSNPNRRNPNFCEKGKQTYMKNRQEPPEPPSPKNAVNVISGGEEVNGVTYTAAKKTSKVTVTQAKRVCQVFEEDSITFDDADANGVMTPQNYALAISLLVHYTNVKRVLIDPGSSVNIILLRVVNKMQADDKMVPKACTLSGFDNSSIVTKGEIMLATFVEGVVKDTNFQVIDTDMAYNMILGRLWIHNMDVVPSTLHQVIKFRSQWGIR